jgi:hypothetical protein
MENKGFLNDIFMINPDDGNYSISSGLEKNQYPRTGYNDYTQNNQNTNQVINNINKITEQYNEEDNKIQFTFYNRLQKAKISRKIHIFTLITSLIAALILKTFYTDLLINLKIISFASTTITTICLMVAIFSACRIFFSLDKEIKDLQNCEIYNRATLKQIIHNKIKLISDLGEDVNSLRNSLNDLRTIEDIEKKIEELKKKENFNTESREETDLPSINTQEGNKTTGFGLSANEKNLLESLTKFLENIKKINGIDLSSITFNQDSTSFKFQGIEISYKPKSYIVSDDNVTITLDPKHPLTNEISWSFDTYLKHKAENILSCNYFIYNDETKTYDILPEIKSLIFYREFVPKNSLMRSLDIYVKDKNNINVPIENWTKSTSVKDALADVISNCIKYSGLGYITSLFGKKRSNQKETKNSIHR